MPWIHPLLRALLIGPMDQPSATQQPPQRPTTATQTCPAAMAWPEITSAPGGVKSDPHGSTNQGPPPRWVTYGIGALLGFVSLVMIVGHFLLERPPAQTPTEYAMTSEGAVVDCAKAYGVYAGTTQPEARAALVQCVAAMRAAHKLDGP